MNTINIVNGEIKDYILEGITLEQNDNCVFLNVNKLVITVNKDTNLIINFKSKKLEKWNIIIDVLDGVNFNLFEIQSLNISKIQYTYNLGINSNVFVFKFNNLKTTKERTLVNLNGENAKFDYHFKTISTDLEDYDYVITHNARKTESYLSLNGINIKNGKLCFNITGDVLRGISECVVDQDSRIINLTNNTCVINPNLLIEEYNVTANHSAFIGKFNDEEMFYLQSRGIDKNIATKMLIKGFLLNGLGVFIENTEELEKIINKYWR